MAGEEAFERAMKLIEKSHQPTVETKKVIKLRRVVEVKSLCQDDFIETQEQIERFLGALRKELETAIAAQERIQIK